MNPRVDVFMRKLTSWQEEYALLRQIAISTGLTEDLKWMHPCYTLDNKNVFLLHAFKEYIAVFFHKGAIMKDPQGILIQQTENVQAGRQLRFKSLDEIVKAKKVIKAYMTEAIAIEEARLQVPMKKPVPVELPKDVAAVMKKIPRVEKYAEKILSGKRMNG